jgi:tRNA dimethylallyltransferase
LEDAKVQMRRLTRNFVRRQANWFKQEDANIQWFDRDQINLDEMEKRIRLFIG